jgi:hypothetical protein
MPGTPTLEPNSAAPASAKGLEVARDFFFGWGMPLLEVEYPDLAQRLAAGRISGSDVLGGDDAISRDHFWGPHFDLFLSEADYAAFGEKLSKTMNAAGPNPWKGYRLIGDPPTSVNVHSIPAWIKSWTGISRPSRAARYWNRANESQLYFLRHGAVFVDRSGELSNWRSALHEYPEAILRRRLSEETFRVWHHGEYNFVQRMARRGDRVAAAICLGEFLTGVMRITLLMDRDFAPYWKWLAFEFRKRPAAAPYTPLLEALVSTDDVEQQARWVTDICAMVHEQLIAGGWVSGRGGRRLPLLNDKIELDRPRDRGVPRRRSAPKGQRSTAEHGGA